MIKFKAGAERLVVGIDQRNLGALQDDNPLVIRLDDITGSAHLREIVVVYRPTLRELVSDLVAAGVLPQRFLDEWRDPAPGQVRQVRT